MQLSCIELLIQLDFFLSFQIADAQFCMCNDCIREIAVAMNFRKKAIESNNIILSASVSVIVKPEVDEDYVVTTFDFSPVTPMSVDALKSVTKIESSSEEEPSRPWTPPVLGNDEQPWSPFPPEKVKRNKTKREKTKVKTTRGPYKKKLKPKEEEEPQ